MKYKNMQHSILVSSLILFYLTHCHASFPMVINTWNLPIAAETVWSIMKKEHLSALDALTIGCTVCEVNQCNHAVGYGGSPDENGETTLDAMIFDGATMDMGAVGGLRRIKSAMKVARYVLEYTTHSFIVGDLATDFAKKFGLAEESLSTNYSHNISEKWKENNCQPNFWKNVVPDSTKFCGPYQPISSPDSVVSKNDYPSDSHDTIGMIAIDEDGNVVAGTSTNGLTYKIAGRVGDSPIAGAGAYADNAVGAAVATGNGDIMMRFLPSFLAVEEMRRGASPAEAAKTVIGRIREKYPTFDGAVIVVNNQGEYAAACNGRDLFPYAVANKKLGDVIVENVECS